LRLLRKRLQKFQSLIPLFAEFKDEEIWAVIETKRKGDHRGDGAPEDLKLPEWRIFSSPDAAAEGRDFRVKQVPRQDSTGGKQKLGPISKQGDRYLRRILIVGAIAVLRRARENPGKYPWLTQLLARRPFKVVAVALANKMARIASGLLAHGGTYRAPEIAAAA